MTSEPPTDAPAEDRENRLAALDVFVEFTEAVGTTTDVPVLVRRAIDVLRARFPDASAAYYEPDPDGRLWRARVWSDDLPAAIVETVRAGLPADAPAIEFVRRARQAVFVDAGTPGGHGIEDGGEYGVAASVPLVEAGEVLGVLGVGRRGARAWLARDRALLRAVGRGLSLALERAHAAARLEARNAELDARARALERFAELARLPETDPLALVRRAQDAVVELMGGGFAVYAEPDGTAWRPRSQAGVPEGTDLGAAIAPGFRRAWDGGRPVHPPDGGPDAEGMAALPVRVGERVQGVFGYASPGRAWTPADRATLEAAVTSLGLALERAGHLRAVEDERRKLAAANEELEAFAYSVSHDLRTPVRHILGFTDVLRGSLGDRLDARSERYLSMVHDAARRMNTLIDAMLDLSRTSRLPLRLGPVDLADLLADARTELRADVLGRTVTWRLGALPTVEGDRELLRQVLLNLLSNALKYTRDAPEARIEVWAEDRPDEVEVFVRDNGAGFDPRYADKLFGVFQRLHREADFEGSGVGLANVRRIVQRHGGRVGAVGRVGEGATFGFTLPKTRAGGV